MTIWKHRYWELKKQILSEIEFTGDTFRLGNAHTRSASSSKPSYTCKHLRWLRKVPNTRFLLPVVSSWRLRRSGQFEYQMKLVGNPPPPTQTLASSAATSQGLWPIELNDWREMVNIQYWETTSRTNPFISRKTFCVSCDQSIHLQGKKKEEDSSCNS